MWRCRPPPGRGCGVWSGLRQLPEALDCCDVRHRCRNCDRCLSDPAGGRGLVCVGGPRFGPLGDSAIMYEKELCTRVSCWARRSAAPFGLKVDLMRRRQCDKVVTASFRALEETFYGRFSLVEDKCGLCIVRRAGVNARAGRCVRTAGIRSWLASRPGQGDSDSAARGCARR